MHIAYIPIPGDIIIENPLGIFPEPHYFNIRSTFIHNRHIFTTTSKKPRDHDLYSSPTIICVIKTTIMTCVGHVARIGGRRIAHRDLAEKPEGDRSLGRTSRRWRHNVKMILQRFN
jgi:hypothetical protein